MAPQVKLCRKKTERKKQQKGITTKKERQKLEGKKFFLKIGGRVKIIWGTFLVDVQHLFGRRLIHVTLFLKKKFLLLFILPFYFEFFLFIFITLSHSLSISFSLAFSRSITLSLFLCEFIFPGHSCPLSFLSAPHSCLFLFLFLIHHPSYRNPLRAACFSLSSLQSSLSTAACPMALSPLNLALLYVNSCRDIVGFFFLQRGIINMFHGRYKQGLKTTAVPFWSRERIKAYLAAVQDSRKGLWSLYWNILKLFMKDLKRIWMKFRGSCWPKDGEMKQPYAINIFIFC